MTCKHKRKQYRLGVAGGALAAVIAFFFVANLAGTGTAAEIAPGKVSVVDGDTLQIGDKVYNLYGIDAPELGQLCFQDGRWNRCGVTAAFELK